MNEIDEIDEIDEDDFDYLEEFEELIDYEEMLGDPPECQTGQYVLGTVRRDLLLDNRVDLRIFFRFEYQLVEEWTFTPYYLPETHFSDRLEIIQVIVKDDVYTSVIKTYWLRVFQRAWRRLYQERQRWLQTVRKNIVSFVTQRSLGPGLLYPTYM